MGEGDLFKEVLKIKTDVRSLQHQTSWLLRAQAPELQQYWTSEFGLGTGKRANYSAMRVYLAVNGKRTINEIAAVAAIQRPDASKILTRLEKRGLIEPLPQKTANSKIYIKTPADAALDITPTLEAALAAKTAIPTTRADRGDSSGA